MMYMLLIVHPLLPPNRHYDSLLPVLNEVSAASQLVDAVEATPGPMRMPRMMQLVKQLEKELDVRKIFTEFRQKSGTLNDSFYAYF